MDDMSRDELLDRLHRDGAALAMIVADKWVGIRRNDAGDYCVVEGPLSNPDGFKRRCYCPSYEAAMDVFRDWWGCGFTGSPPCPYIRPL